MIKTIIANGKAEYAALSGLAGRDGEDATGSHAASDTEAAVRQIIENVRTRGDEAVREYSEKFDGYVPDKLVLTRDDMKRGYDAAPKEFCDAILHAAENIRAYHEKQVQQGYETKRDDGVVVGQMVRGMARVGLYVPGGTAAYPSTVLMNAIPAKLAGVGELVMVTPPRKDAARKDKTAEDVRTDKPPCDGTDRFASGDADTDRPLGDGADRFAEDGVGICDPEDLQVDCGILAAAFVAGVDKIILAGGAQAVAALAYGTETFPKVDKIVGPGNVYVATAKRMLYGLVDIDMIAGPSEILIIADGNALPAYIAADMLSQAEHDPMAASILLTTSNDVAERTASEIELQLESLERQEIARQSIETNGRIIICRSEDEMVKLANEAAPEHLEIQTEDPLGFVPRIRNAGSIFCGPYSPEPLGDYYAGTNHVLPTSGTARYASPLGVYDFIKRTSYTYYTKAALEEARDDIITIGEAEGLTAHVRAVKKRFEYE
ncbi:MAG: histidinol dehydrogenase [Clostridiales Family XIII bacterium]|jgi:histidinol dehydrogenase|nr:histidinol dehydrogenase [Clostridiales Family XIII bacterium]